MSAPVKLGGFAAALIAVFTLGAGLGAAFGPSPSTDTVDAPPAHVPADADTGSHGSVSHSSVSNGSDVAGHGG